MVTVKPRNVSFIKFIYDWDKNAACFINNEKTEMLDSWRGTLNNPEFYALIALLQDLNDNIFEELTILQKKP